MPSDHLIWKNAGLRKSSLLVRYSFAAGLFLIALFLRFQLQPIDWGVPFAFFYPVILIAFYLYGSGPGILVAILSGLSGEYYFVAPYSTFSLDQKNYPPLVFFALTSALIGLIITRLHSLTDALKLQVSETSSKEEQLRFVLDGSELGFWDWDIVAGKVERNERWALMLGYTYEEIKHTTQQWTDFVYPEDRERAWQSIRDVLEGRTATHKAEYRMLQKDGSIRWILDQAKVMQRDSSGKPTRMCGTHTDITAKKNIEEEFKHQAHEDFLTGLNSRGHFMEMAELELSRSTRYEIPVSLLMMDIDLFKQINDTHGHKTGDLALKKLAEVCRQTLREVDLIGRIGGEEFAILLPETGKEEAIEVAERLRAALATSKVPLTSGGLPISFTVSIGVTSQASKEDNIDVLLSQADKALYDAKNSGRNRVSVAPQ